MLKCTGMKGYITEHITAHTHPASVPGWHVGGPTRVPKNGNAARYPGRPYDPPGYAMTTWRLCARATQVNRHFV